VKEDYKMKPNQRQRVAAYIRVSSSHQADAYGPDVQRKAIQSFADSQNYEIVKWYEDLGVTGSVLERPALNEMIKESQNFSMVITHRIDRMSRSLRDLLKIIDEILEPKGIALKSVSESFIDTSTPQGRALFSVMGTFSELDKNLLVNKLKNGREEAHEKGFKSVGACPTGYETFSGRLTINNEWAEVVKRIFTMALQGTGVNRIARILNEEGITTRNECKFYARTVKLILTNRTYVGMAKNGTERKGVHQAIVSPSVFGRVQRVLKKVG
jgi:site-specific DNA recombinase